jgi:hypothetical protein
MRVCPGGMGRRGCGESTSRRAPLRRLRVAANASVSEVASLAATRRSPRFAARAHFAGIHTVISLLPRFAQA